MTLIILKILLWIVGIVVATIVIPMIFIATAGISHLKRSLPRGRSLDDAVDIDMSTITNDETFKYAVAWVIRIFLVGWTLLVCYWIFDIAWLLWGSLASLALILFAWLRGLSNIKRKFHF